MRGVSLTCCLLLLPACLQAQSDPGEASPAPNEIAEQGEPLQSPTAPPASQLADDELRGGDVPSMSYAELAAMQAGSCPVITDVLLGICAEHPEDPGCRAP